MFICFDIFEINYLKKKLNVLLELKKGSHSLGQGRKAISKQFYVLKLIIDIYCMLILDLLFNYTDLILTTNKSSFA